MNCEFAGDTITGRHQEGPEEEWRISNSRVTRSLDGSRGGVRGKGEECFGVLDHWTTPGRGVRGGREL